MNPEDSGYRSSATYLGPIRRGRKIRNRYVQRIGSNKGWHITSCTVKYEKDMQNKLRRVELYFTNPSNYSYGAFADPNTMRALTQFLSELSQGQLQITRDKWLKVSDRRFCRVYAIAHPREFRIFHEHAYKESLYSGICWDAAHKHFFRVR